MSYSRYKSHEAETLQDVILLNCEKFADKTALHWLNEECNVTEQYTYAEIKERTREIAAGLQLLLGERTKTGVDARERAVLCYPPGLEFILTFIASLRAGIIPGNNTLTNFFVVAVECCTKQAVIYVPPSLLT